MPAYERADRLLLRTSRRAQGVAATKRLAVARFWFEGNAFSPVLTTLASFHVREWTSGTAELDTARGTEWRRVTLSRRFP
jgi:hypothetical protein